MLKKDSEVDWCLVQVGKIDCYLEWSDTPVRKSDEVLCILYMT